MSKSIGKRAASLANKLYEIAEELDMVHFGEVNTDLIKLIAIQCKIDWTRETEWVLEQILEYVKTQKTQFDYLSEFC